MRKNFLASICIILLFSLKSAAQTYGCLVGSTTTGTLYRDTDITGIYYITFGRTYQTSPPACPRAQLGPASGGCRFTLLGSNTHTRYEYTTITTSSSPIACDLDHYAYGAVLIAGVFVFRRMRR